MSHKKIVIIGGGAAGFFSAIHNKKNNLDSTVILIEKSKEILSKVKISGGGRCNVTHACFDPKTLTQFYPRGSKELLSPFYRFQPKDTMEWFEQNGVPLKIESDNRVFPQSDSSQSIIDCLVQIATNLDIKIWTECGVSTIQKKANEFHLQLSNDTTLQCEKLILATGSNRSGYELAKTLGHTIEKPIPSLFTVKINDPELHKRSGLSVEHATAYLGGHKNKLQEGPLLVTHWGLSGPAIIKLSAWNAKELFDVNYQTILIINWLPRLSIESIKKTLETQKTAHPNKQILSHSPFQGLPKRLWEYLAKRAGIEDAQIWQTLQKKQLNKLIQELNQGQFQITGKGQFKEEFVTCGGVKLKEVDFKTMESKVCKGLHIIGELLNIDGVTGGFNFQNAWTTGFLSAN